MKKLSDHTKINTVGGAFHNYLETEYHLFPPVTIFLDLFPRAGYFFSASD